MAQVKMGYGSLAQLLSMYTCWTIGYIQLMTREIQSVVRDDGHPSGSTGLYLHTFG
jgi:hypothetical protein